MPFFEISALGELRQQVPHCSGETVLPDHAVGHAGACIQQELAANFICVSLFAFASNKPVSFNHFTNPGIEKASQNYEFAVIHEVRWTTVLMSEFPKVMPASPA